MPMHEGDVLSQHDRSEVGQECNEVRERCRGCNGGKGDVVDLQAGNKPAHADAVWRMAMGDDDDLRCRTRSVDPPYTYIKFVSVPCVLDG
jgi:hypothetical protein